MQAKDSNRGDAPPDPGGKGAAEGGEVSLRPNVSVKTSNLSGDGFQSSMPLSPQWLFKSAAPTSPPADSKTSDAGAKASAAAEASFSFLDSALGGDGMGGGGFGKERWKEGTKGPLVATSGFPLPQPGEWRGDRGRDSVPGFREGPPNTHKPHVMRALNLGPSALLADPVGNEQERGPNRWGRDDRDGHRNRGGGWKEGGNGDRDGEGGPRGHIPGFNKPSGFTNPRWNNQDGNNQRGEDGQGWGRHGQHHREDRGQGQNVRNWTREEERWSENQNQQFRGPPGKWNNGADKWSGQPQNRHGDQGRNMNEQQDRQHRQNWNGAPPGGFAPRERGSSEGRGQPLRPGRVGFTIGRGRGLGGRGMPGALGSSLVGPPIGGVDGGFTDRFGGMQGAKMGAHHHGPGGLGASLVPPRSAAPPKPRPDPSKTHQYTRTQLWDVYDELSSQANGLSCPANVDPNNVPMKWAEGNPDAPLYELLVEAQTRGAGRANRNWNQDKDDETPEWAQEGGPADPGSASKTGTFNAFRKDEESWIKAKVLSEVQAGADDMESSWLNEIADVGRSEPRERPSEDSMDDNKVTVGGMMNLADLEQSVGADHEEMDSPGLAAEGLVSQLLGVGLDESSKGEGAPDGEPAPAAHKPTGHADPMITVPGPAGPVHLDPAKLDMDTWFYQDPQGDQQGPFTRNDIIDWLEAGYFPADLPMRHAGVPAELGFRPLQMLLPLWGNNLGGVQLWLPQQPMDAGFRPPPMKGMAMVTPSPPTNALGPDAMHAFMEARQQPHPAMPHSNTLLEELMGEEGPAQGPEGMRNMFGWLEEKGPTTEPAPTASSTAPSAGSAAQQQQLTLDMLGMPADASMPSMPGGMRTLADIEAETMRMAHLSPGGTTQLQSPQQQQQGMPPFPASSPLSIFQQMGQAGGQEAGMPGMPMFQPPSGVKVRTLEEIEAGKGEGPDPGGAAPGPEAFRAWGQPAMGAPHPFMPGPGQMDMPAMDPMMAGLMGPGGLPGMGPMHGMHPDPIQQMRDATPAPHPDQAHRGKGDPTAQTERKPDGEPNTAAAAAPAPWAAAAPEGARQKSLKEIQEEEKQQRAKEDAQLAARMSAVQAQARADMKPAGSPWGAPAAGASATGKTLQDIQREEQAAAALAAAKQAAQRAGGDRIVPGGSAGGGAAWGAAPPAAGPPATAAHLQAAEESSRGQPEDDAAGGKESKNSRRKRANKAKVITASVLGEPDWDGEGAQGGADAGGGVAGVNGRSSAAAQAQGSMWGSSQAPPKSLREIQEEQIRHSAAAAMAHAAQAPQSTNLAGAWSRPNQMTTKPPQTLNNAPSGGNADMFWDAPLLSNNDGGKVAHPQLQSQASGTPWGATPQNAPAPTTGSSQFPGLPSAAAGGAVPGTQPQRAAKPAEQSSTPQQETNQFRRWCQSQLMEINHTDDLTLVDYLLSSNPSASEVQEYMEVYLGSSQKVKTFATEFLQRRNTEGAKAAAHAKDNFAPMSGGQRAPKAGDDWEQTFKQKTKKTKSKKKLDPSLLGFNVESDRIMKGEIAYAED